MNVENLEKVEIQKCKAEVRKGKPEVRIVGFDMSVWEITRLLLKCIPALMLYMVIVGFMITLFGVIFGGCINNLVVGGNDSGKKNSENHQPKNYRK